jgi:hypothetical protein
MLFSAMVVQILSAPRSPAPSPVSPKRRSPPKPFWSFASSIRAFMLVMKKLKRAPPPASRAGSPLLASLRGVLASGLPLDASRVLVAASMRGVPASPVGGVTSSSSSSSPTSSSSSSSSAAASARPGAAAPSLIAGTRASLTCCASSSSSSRESFGLSASEQEKTPSRLRAQQESVSER